MRQTGKEIVNLEAIGDRAARELSDALSNTCGRHLLPSEVYVMITFKLGLESDVFTAPFAIRQDQSKGIRGTTFADRLSDVGNLITAKCTVAEHIEEVIAYHPGVAFILDQETASALSKDEKRPVALIDYGDDHCLLTGLNARGIDVFLTCPMDVIRAAGGLTIIEYKP